MSLDRAYYLLQLIKPNLKNTRGHSLIGKTAILHIVISGSSPDVSSHII
jgi:hypothetical protein